MNDAINQISQPGVPVAGEHPSGQEAGQQPAAVADSSPAPDDNGWEWAIVEIFGHRRHAGRCREEEKFGAKMLRVDVPAKGDPIANGWETHWYGGASIFSYTLTDEASALRINTPYEAASRFPLPPPADEDFDTGEDDES